MGRNYLRQGDAVNAALAAAGYNFSLLIQWLRLLRFRFLAALLRSPPRVSLKSSFFTDDERMATPIYDVLS
jgi:IS5 family transposase